MTFLVCMSSWEKWVFPQEVNAFPSPSFFSRSPSPCSLQSYSPSNLFVRSERPPTSHPIFQALPGTRQNNAPRGNSCITCVKLCEPRKERQAIMEGDRQGRDCRGIGLHFHLFNIKHWWRLFDCRQLLAAPEGPQKVKPARFFGQEVMPTVKFLFP